MPKRKRRLYATESQLRAFRKGAPARQAARFRAEEETRQARKDEVEALLGVSNTQLQSPLFQLPHDVRTYIFRYIFDFAPPKTIDSPQPRPGWRSKTVSIVTTGARNRMGFQDNRVRSQIPHSQEPQPWCLCGDCKRAFQETQMGNTPGRVNIITTYASKRPYGPGKRGLGAYRCLETTAFLRTCKAAYAIGIPIMYGSGRTWSFILDPYYSYYAYGIPLRTAELFFKSIGPVSIKFLSKVSIVLERDFYYQRRTRKPPTWFGPIFALLKQCQNLQSIEAQLCQAMYWWKWGQREKHGICTFTATEEGKTDELVDAAQRFWAENGLEDLYWALPRPENQSHNVLQFDHARLGSVVATVEWRANAPDVRGHTPFAMGADGDEYSSRFRFYTHNPDV